MPLRKLFHVVIIIWVLQENYSIEDYHIFIPYQWLPVYKSLGKVRIRYPQLRFYQDSYPTHDVISVSVIDFWPFHTRIASGLTAELPYVSDEWQNCGACWRKLSRKNGGWEIAFLWFLLENLPLDMPNSFWAKLNYKAPFAHIYNTIDLGVLAHYVVMSIVSSTPLGTFQW